MSRAFDLFHLQPAASLNSRRFLVTAPEDRDIEGKTAYEVLSAQALAQRTANTLALGALPSPTTSEAIRQLSHALFLDNPMGAAARTLVEQYGRRLGYFLAFMNPTNRLSPVEDAWEKAYLEHWANGIDEIILGGGLVTGHMGELIAHAAQQALVQTGRNLKLTVAAHPHLLPLIGAARSYTRESKGALVVADFGQSGAKSGVAAYDENGTLISMHQRPTVEIARLTVGEDVGELAAAMSKILIEVYQERMQKGSVAPHIICTLAAYLDDHQQPVKSSRGAYTRLHSIAQPLSLSAWLSNQVSHGLGTKVHISFLRDAEAAALAYAGLRPSKATAVLMLGTALGVGFVPEAKSHRPIAGDFVLS